MRNLLRAAFVAGLVSCALIFVAATHAQLLNAGHLSVSIRQAETVFDNSGNPWPFFSQTPSVAYDQGGSGIAYVATANASCATNGSSYRSDYINFNADAGQTPPFRIGCFAAGQLYRTTVNISSSTPGPYVVNLNVANGGGGTASAAVLLDGTQVATITIPNTGSYSTFTTAQSAQFPATAGNHIIAISCLTGDSTNNACGDMRWFQGGNPPAATTPQPAAAAGFTTLAIDSDFTDTFHATASNWLDCAGASNPEWYRGWITLGFGSPCSAIRAGVTDPAFGNRALNLHWDDSIWTGGPPDKAVTVIETIRGDGAAGKMFTFGFFEVVGRWSTVINVGGNGGATFDLWNVAPNSTPFGNGDFEWDGVEIGGSNRSDSCARLNSPLSINCAWSDTAPPANTSSDPTQYHRYAWRVTGTGQTGSLANWRFCSYYEETPDVSGLVQQGSCVNLPGSGNTSTDNQHLSGNGISTAFIMMSGPDFRCDPAASCFFGQPLEFYVKRARAYVCPLWTANQSNFGAASQCPTASANP